MDFSYMDWWGHRIQSGAMQTIFQCGLILCGFFQFFFIFFIDLIKNINELTCVCILSNYIHTHFCIKNEINAKNK